MKNITPDEAIKSFLFEHKKYSELNFKSIDSDFNVTVAFRNPIGASKRGGLLLDLEEDLCGFINSRIRIWCDVVADKSKLRQLRGIKFEN